MSGVSGQKTYSVLFLGTANATRSPMAEALLERYSGGRFCAYSAGTRPAGAVHPLALRQLALFNHNTERLCSKSWDEFAGSGGPALDFVFTVCDRAITEPASLWPGRPMTTHWGLDDPALAEGTEEQKLKQFRRAYLELEGRIKIFTSLRMEALNRLALQERLQQSGTVHSA